MKHITDFVFYFFQDPFLKKDTKLVNYFARVSGGSLIETEPTSRLAPGTWLDSRSIDSANSVTSSRLGSKRSSQFTARTEERPCSRGTTTRLLSDWPNMKVPDRAGGKSVEKWSRR